MLEMEIAMLIEIPMMTNSEWNEFVNRPFNPPKPTISDDDFRVEFCSVEDGLRAILAELGYEDEFLDNCFGRTRGMGFQMPYDCPLETPMLVPAIQSWLSGLVENYDIAIMGENYDFYVYVSRDRIVAYTKDLTRLRNLGLVPKPA
jgi:hypothetical protein